MLPSSWDICNNREQPALYFQLFPCTHFITFWSSDLKTSVDIGDFTDTFKQSVKDKVHQGTKQRSMLARMTIRARSEL